MSLVAKNPAARLGVYLALLVACWLVGAALGAWLLAPHLARGEPRSVEELADLGRRYGGGLGLYLGAQAAAVWTLRLSGLAEAARRWRGRFWGFHFIVLQMCAIGGLLGGLAFLGAGTLIDSRKSAAELVVLGVKSGAFYFLVWGPGFALVRMFIRGAKQNPAASSAPPDGE